MSRQRRAAKKRQTKSYGDVTINDFANSTVCKSREKKSSSNVSTAIKEETEKSWDDKDFETDFDFVEEENEDGTISFVLKKVTEKPVETSTQLDGNDYPLDVWFLISNYIRPEDVGTFSSICKTSHAVASSAKFWFTLYKRYYSNVPNLPKRLHPDCMQRLYGLRTLVIRMLFFTYPLFTNRLKEIKTEEHPDVLLKRQCNVMWHRKHKTQWVYYFKFKQVNNFIGVQKMRTQRGLDFMEVLEDVSANVENHCRILQVTCVNFIPVPPVIGMYLVSTSVTLSQGFRHKRIHLAFGSGPFLSQKQAIYSSGSINILLDPVISVKILDWWHPLYPHMNNIIDLLPYRE